MGFKGRYNISAIEQTNLKLTIAYDGGAYLGWQKTRMGPTIEETLEQILKQVLQEPVTLQAASRTDAGVHAKGQVINFRTSKQNLCLSRLQVSLNSLLPKDISVMHLEEEKSSFHPTLDCIAKEYHYLICFGTAQWPDLRHFAWHYPKKIEILSMKAAAQMLVGEHDFSAFCNAKKNSTYKHYVRTVHKINLVELSDCYLRFEITGNQFLYKMVRNLVGTIVYVGCGKIPLESLPHIIENKIRPKAGITAPAHGLCLYKVYYSPV